MVGAVDSRVTCSVGVGRAAAASVLPGLLRLPPVRILSGGGRSPLHPFALCGLGLGVVPATLGFGLTLAYLPCPAWCDRGRGCVCSCTVYRVTKSVPLILYTD